MGKISLVSAKYIIHASIEIEGIVDRPDVIGAIFGQTEGLLGADLELRELQRGGRIGRIEVNLDTKGGKSKGTLVIPSSLDKAETAIVGAALEVIERIGPCDAKIKIEKIEDIRISKRKYIIERAKTLLRTLVDKVMPDSQELSDEVAYAVRVMEIQEYGREKLACGPAIDESDEIIVVEGRADVITLLKHGFKNAIAMNGSSVPDTIIELSKKKTITAFVDGDRGGLLNAKQLLDVSEIDFVSVAPDGKEVEELTKKEIHKCLRSRITAEQFSLEHSFSDKGNSKQSDSRENEQKQGSSQGNQSRANQRDPPKEKAYNGPQQRKPLINMGKKSSVPQPSKQPSSLSQNEKDTLKQKIEDLIGTKAAYILDSKLSILGKVPISELISTVEGMKNEVYSIVLDGAVSKELASLSDKIGINTIAAVEKDSSVKCLRTRIIIYDEM